MKIMKINKNAIEDTNRKSNVWQNKTIRHSRNDGWKYFG